MSRVITLDIDPSLKYGIPEIHAVFSDPNPALETLPMLVAAAINIRFFSPRDDKQNKTMIGAGINQNLPPFEFDITARSNPCLGLNKTNIYARIRFFE